MADLSTTSPPLSIHQLTRHYQPSLPYQLPRPVSCSSAKKPSVVATAPRKQSVSWSKWGLPEYMDGKEELRALEEAKKEVNPVKLVWWSKGAAPPAEYGEASSLNTALESLSVDPSL
jgi:hypothetical protein